MAIRLPWSPKPIEPIQPEEESFLDSFVTSAKNIWTTLTSIPDKVVAAENIISFADEDPGGFYQDLTRVGRTPDSETVLRGLGAQDTDIDEILPPPTPMQTRVSQAFKMIPTMFHSNIIQEGRTPETEEMVKARYPQISEQGLEDFFKPPPVSMARPAISVGAGGVTPAQAIRTAQPYFPIDLKTQDVLARMLTPEGVSIRDYFDIGGETTTRQLKLPLEKGLESFTGPSGEERMRINDRNVPVKEYVLGALENIRTNLSYTGGVPFHELRGAQIPVVAAMILADLFPGIKATKLLLQSGLGKQILEITTEEIARKVGREAMEFATSEVGAVGKGIGKELPEPMGKEAFEQAGKTLGGELPEPKLPRPTPVTPEVTVPKGAKVEIGEKGIKITRPLSEIQAEEAFLDADTRPKFDVAKNIVLSRLRALKGTVEKSELSYIEKQEDSLIRLSYDTWKKEGWKLPKAEPGMPEAAAKPLAPLPKEVPSTPTEKLIKLVKSAKPARKATEQLKHEELTRRVGIAAKALEEGEGAKAFEISKGALKGTLPEADFYVDLEAAGIKQTDINDLFNMINHKQSLQYFQKLNTAESLQKILNGQIPTEGELTLLEDMFGSDLIKAVLDKRTAWQKTVPIIEEVMNIPRTLETMADLSATLRQGVVLAAGQPVQFGQALVKEAKAVFSAKNARLVDEAIRQLPHADLAAKSKLYLAPLGQVAPRVSAREEAFMGRILEKVPGLGSIVRASERAYVTFLNVLRANTFEYYAKAWEGTGKSVADYEKLASFINHATGRGDLPSWARSSGAVLNATFFSPRYITSRLQLPLDLFTTTPAVRKVVARNLAAFVGAGMGIVALAKLGGAGTEESPISSDFGKIKIGNTRYDFWGGFLPYVRLVGQLITGKREVTKTGEVVEINRKDIIDTFTRSKLGPIPGLVWDLAEARTFIGEELTAENAPKILLEKLLPMFITDIVDAIRDTGLLGGAIALPSILGVGVQTYSDNWNTNGDKLGLPSDVGGLSVPIVYTTKDYYGDTSKEIGGAIGDMLKAKKDLIPAKVIAVAEAKDINKQLGEMRTGSLTDLNTDVTKGDTYEQYYAQYQARQKLTDEKELAEFDKLYPNANRGNMTQREFALLKEYQSLGPIEQKQFIIDHPELSQNPREEYLKSHPEENAKLAIWGQAKIMTQKAYDMAQKLITQLDIPDSAVEPFLPSKELAKPYFELLDTIEEWGPNSWEARLIGANNPKLFEWLGREPVKDRVEVLELKIKNRDLQTKFDALLDKDSPDYIADEKARLLAREEFKKANSKFADDLRRIEAYDNNADDKTVNLWVEHGKKADQETGFNAEEKLWLVDHPEVWKWALDKDLLKDDGTDWNLPVLRIDVKWKKQDTEYDAIKSDNKVVQSNLRDLYLEDNPEYATARIQRDGYEMGLKDVTKWTAYNQLPDYGFWRERYRMENPDFDTSVKGLQVSRGQNPWADLEPEKIPLAQYDEIYEAYKDLFKRYENVQGTDTERDAQRARIFEQNPAFKENWYRRNAYGLLFPEQFVEVYVTYNLMPIVGYARERYLKDNRDFYAEATTRLGWTSTIDWSKIPTERVEALYNQYVTLPTAKQKEDLRYANPDLDLWLVNTKGYTPIADRYREREMTPTEKRQYELSGLQLGIDQQIRKLQESLSKLR